MANSKYEYVKDYERSDCLLPSTYIVIRIDGRGFHRFSIKYAFEKPNDRRASELMNAAAAGVLTEIPEICIAYGLSDEFSFVFDKTCNLFERRESKIITIVVSTFTSYYLYLWTSYFPAKSLSPPLPSFDGRAVLYPSETLLRDYFNWRQVDCHVNNLYNTTFWALVNKGGQSPTQAEQDLKGTLAADKNEILFSRFQVNYNNEPAIFKKGSILYRKASYDAPNIPTTTENDSGPVGRRETGPLSKTQEDTDKKRRAKARIVIEHEDLIKAEFWKERPWLLSGYHQRSFSNTNS
ncbi:tRNA-His guanylyltransferase [Ptychographa xylographoides]|nr:tRNA-His guanylyltransferase [Ptychographa xylographoides]